MIDGINVQTRCFLLLAPFFIASCVDRGNYLSIVSYRSEPLHASIEDDQQVIVKVLLENTTDAQLRDVVAKVSVAFDRAFLSPSYLNRVARQIGKEEFHAAVGRRLEEGGSAKLRALQEVLRDGNFVSSSFLIDGEQPGVDVYQTTTSSNVSIGARGHVWLDLVVNVPPGYQYAGLVDVRVAL